MPAQAGTGRGRWEGLALGLGAVSLYNLFSYGTFAPVVPPRYGPAPGVIYAPPVVYQSPPVVYGAPTVVCPPPDDYDDDECCEHRPERAWVPGHWEWR
jgi:hypothetical protein